MSSGTPRGQRLDQRVVADGLAPSRERAKALILSGVVLVDDTPVTKVGAKVKADSIVRFKSGAGDKRWASRGALKLEPALAHFGLSPADRICLDIGASTGGFTDVLLRRGARRVYAVDVGYGQLAWSLRSDERVVVLERTNARYLSETHVPERCGLAVVDVSFISVRLLLPALISRLAPGAQLLVMVKPQFEVGRGRVGKGGVVRDEGRRQEAIESVCEAAASHELFEQGRRDNDVRGPKGNLETFVLFEVPL